ncbi:hypothetical protein Asi03nite_42190 [Actinoplanes siamensis]|uniref:Uncharacterized protein n=1 Tax=Actinoplanes siamensis TaxID=1223317 RepID=A0A919TL27_9ACTN|nr:hypothetical protein Asi03nite_42190 [Actinoplanes siamensis]
MLVIRRRWTMRFMGYVLIAAPDGEGRAATGYPPARMARQERRARNSTGRGAPAIGPDRGRCPRWGYRGWTSQSQARLRPLS